MVIKMLITFIQLNQEPMKAAPQILLSTRLDKEQTVVSIGFEFRWDIMIIIPGSTYMSENNSRNFKNPFDDMDN